MKTCMACGKLYDGNGRKYCRDCKLKRVQYHPKVQPAWSKRLTYLYEIWLDGKVYIGQTCNPHRRQGAHNVPGAKFEGLPMQIVTIFGDEENARRAESALMARYADRAHNSKRSLRELGSKKSEILREEDT